MISEQKEVHSLIIIRYGLVLLLSYLIGCSSMALYVSKYKKVDLQKAGSGNLGASNTMILLGWKPAIIVGLHDIGKAVLAVVLAKLFCPDQLLIQAGAGVACVLGHMFPFYLRFKGGKGFASYLGMTFALNWKFALIVLLAVIVVTLVSDYIVAGTMTTILVVPTYMGYATRSLPLAGILCIATGAMLIKHKDNYVRLLNGTEVGLRRANRGELRIKK